MMGSRFASHQLSSGLYVSGRPEQPKERQPAMSLTAMPYTGGDIKKSGELGKMFDVPMDGSRSRKSGPMNSVPSRTGSFGGATSHSGQIMPNSANRATSASAGIPSSASINKSYSGPPQKHGEPLKKSSGPQPGGTVSRKHSGPLPPVLPTTGLITSGPISSGLLNSLGASQKASGPLDATGSGKLHTPMLAVTKLSKEDEYSFRRSFPKLILWAMVLLFVMGFIAGGFILGSVHNPILLIVVVVLFSTIAAVFTWNHYWGWRGITSFIAQYPDAKLRTARDGEFVKVSGVVTCGNVPLESSFQKVPRCVYTSTSLYKYRGWDSKAANPKHCPFTWGLQSLERHVVDFYISDFHSGLRALVKAGFGARVTPYVDESVVVDINASNKDISPEFTQWLGERNLSSNDCVMRLKEGYIKEGSSVSVMGLVQRNENVLMIVPPPEPFTTGCQWTSCMLPASLEGIIMSCGDSSKVDVISV
ncbi:hypothetical protein Nepgr_015450 [Nepenthes gracilis]|uniref:Ubiquitin-specific protease family C19-related protein n=1 Tax=Nepenthes gracilis TaxID=150966 RepID=A0AAD3SMU3_NEPGR|nr:hypothetical protein Nepgr_015450 [Nepenthes gracilis]